MMNAGNFNQPNPQFQPPQFQPPQPPTPPENSALKNGLIAVGVLLALMIVLNVVQYFKGNAKVAAMKTEMAEKDKTLQDLQSQYAIMQTRLDSLQNLFPAKEAEIEQLKQQLEQRKNMIVSSVQGGGSLSKARKKIEELTAMNQSLTEELDKVTKENTELRLDLDAMAVKINELTRELDEEKGKTAALRDEIESMKKPPSPGPSGGDSGTTSTSAALPVSGVQVTALEVSTKDPSKTRPAKSAKVMNKSGRIDVSFSVSGNPAVPPGEQQFHIKITAPGGTTIGNAGEGTNKSDGSRYKYSTVASCNYDGSSGQGVGSFTTTGQGLSAGSYTVEIFHNGSKVGDGAFSLKK